LTSDRRQANLWGITCYFNPIGYQRRLQNYHLFRQHLTIPLVAVELAYGDDFDLGADALFMLPTPAQIAIEIANVAGAANART
jgi:hypothetical protein